MTMTLHFDIVELLPVVFARHVCNQHIRLPLIENLYEFRTN